MAEIEALAGALLVSSDGAARCHYDLVHLTYQLGGEQRCVNLVAIAQVAEGGLLVAAPKESWSRVAAEKRLPRGALTSALLVEVAAADVLNPEDAVEDGVMEVWVGVLDKKLVPRLQIGKEENPTYDLYVEQKEDLHSMTLAQVWMPFGPALSEVAEEHFAFASAHSEMEAPPVVPPGEEDLSGRMKKMEETLVQLQTFMQKQFGAKEPDRPRKSALRPTFSKELTMESEIRGLDPSVVSSALQAGIPREQLVTLSGLLKKSSRMEDVPARRPVKGVLSESEEEEEEAEVIEENEADSRSSEPAVAKAVVQLTKIVGSLAAQKSKGKDLDAMLDLVDQGGGDSSASTSSSRSKAALFKKLRSALTESPEKLSRSIEEAIEEDFLQVKASPGVNSLDFSTRAWVEHRSKLQHYPQTIRFAWILAGIHDAMKQKKFEEAKTRTLLGLAAIDQSSLDGGNWTLAQEVLLEPAAPFHSFIGRKIPEVWEQTTSKLLDDRIADVLMWRLKDRDAFVEARKRLQVQKPNPRQDQQPVPAAKPAPKKGPKAKGKGGGKAAPEEEPTAAT